jgi:hypothetical protein
MFSVEGPAPKWGVAMALGAKVLRIKFHFKMLPLMYRSQKCCMQIKSFDPNVVPQALLHTWSFSKFCKGEFKKKLAWCCQNAVSLTVPRYYGDTWRPGTGFKRQNGVELLYHSF